MFKQLLVTSAVLVASSSVAFAAHSYKGERDYKGEIAAPCPTYAYAAGPYLGLSVGVRNNYAADPAVYKGIEGILSAGWGTMLNPTWYLAGEIFAGTSAKVKTFNNSQGLNTKSSWSYGLDIIPGVMLTDYVLGYLRLGVVNTRFTSASVNRTGWRIGLGGQTNIYQNWDLRGEYIYTSYPSVINSLGRVQSDQFNVGVIYKFL